MTTLRCRIAILATAAVSAMIWGTVQAACGQTPSGASADRELVRPPLFPIIVDDLLGFIDFKGNVVVKPQFERIPLEYGSYLDGAVYRDEVPDCSPPRGTSSHFWGFYEGIGTIYQKEKYGFIAADGRLLFAPQFDAVTQFRGGVAWVEQNGTYALVNDQGQIVRSGLEGIGPFSEGLAPVRFEGKWGLIDKDGCLAMERRFEEAVFGTYKNVPLVHRNIFDGGVAWVRIGTQEGLIDRNGRVLVEPQFDSLSSFDAGVARCRKGVKEGLIDRRGQIVIPIAYDGVGELREGMVPVEAAGKWGFVNLRNEAVVASQFDDVQPFQEGFARVSLAKRVGFVDHAGKLVIPTQFLEATDFRSGLAIVSADGKKFGVIDYSGKFVVPAKYDRIGEFSEGLAVVRSGDRVGAVDVTGDLVVPLKFAWIGSFKHGFALVQNLKRKFGVIDGQGRFLLEPKYQWIDQTETEGLRRVQDDEYKQGYINSAWQLVIAPQFEWTEPFEHGVARVGSDVPQFAPSPDAEGVYPHYGKWGYINLRGEYIWKPTD